MATKKQKREALEEKRRLDLVETQEAGLKALEKDRARRAKIAEKRAKEEEERQDKLAKERRLAAEKELQEAQAQWEAEQREQRRSESVQRIALIAAASRG